MRRPAWIWMPIVASGLGACANTTVEDDAWASGDAPPDAPEGTWSRCCPGAHLGIPGGLARGSGDSLECFCPAAIACNYGWGSCFMDAGSTPALDDTGFADAGPIDDAAIDALITDDARP